MYNNERNEGIRCIREIVSGVQKNFSEYDISYDVYDTRFKNEIPGLENDIFISSGGPGNPFDGKDSDWEKKYFNLIDKIYSHNQNESDRKKYLFFICHSFQMMARFYHFGEVSKRSSKSIGVMPFSKTEEGKNDPILKSLSDPFYAADIRQYQVTNPDTKVIDDLGAKILSMEIVDDANLPLAITAIRISNEIAGTQFHPEADPESMIYHFRKPEEKQEVIENYGEERYNKMIKLLDQPDTIAFTRKTVIPNFLNNAIDELSKVLI